MFANNVVILINIFQNAIYIYIVYIGILCYKTQTIYIINTKLKNARLVLSIHTIDFIFITYISCRGD